MRRTPTICSWPIMFPKRRSERDTGLARCPIISMGSIKGASHQTGPVKCLKYLSPCSLTPITWVAKKTIRASAKVVLRFAVGGRSPGMRPSTFDTKMKTAKVSTKGKYFLPLCPMVSSTRLLKAVMTSSSIDCVCLGTSLSLPAIKTENIERPMIMYIMKAVWAWSPNVGIIVSCIEAFLPCEVDHGADRRYDGQREPGHQRPGAHKPFYYEQGEQGGDKGEPYRVRHGHEPACLLRAHSDSPPRAPYYPVYGTT